MNHTEKEISSMTEVKGFLSMQVYLACAVLLALLGGVILSAITSSPTILELIAFVIVWTNIMTVALSPIGRWVFRSDNRE